jgi:hypothetical protein
VTQPAILRHSSLLRVSLQILRRHPVVSAALGFAVVLSLASTVFGIGVLVTPWFVCEIFALQLAILTDRPTARSGAWVRAALLALFMFGMVAVATWLAVLAIGPDVSTADSAAGPLPWPDALERVGLIAAVTALTVGFIAPFSYAPLILIERGGRIGEAVLESAWLVRRGGLVRHWVLAFLTHLLPLAPAIVLAVAVARTFERAATPVGVLLALPLLPLSIPLGQGLLSAAYVERRAELPERRWARAEGAAPRALRIVLIALVLAPMTSVLSVAAGALRPSLPRSGDGAGELVTERAIEHESTIFVPDTTIAVHVEGRLVEVRASDGLVARFSGPWRVPIDRARVTRHGDLYDLALASEARRWVVSVDRAGVRVDDSIGDRLRRRLPSWALPSIALAFALSALLLVQALEPLGALRRAYAAPAHDRPPLETLRVERRLALRRAWIIAAILLPASIVALAGGLHAALG